MKQRLLIGVICCEGEHLMQRRLIKGIMSQAFSLDMDVAIYEEIRASVDAVMG